jgi:membrane protein required for colicin V production
MPAFTTLDWIFIGLLTLSCVIGLWRGLIAEVMALTGWGVAVVVAYLFADPLSAKLTMTELGDTARYILAFAIIFILTMLIWSLIASLLQKAVNALGLTIFDRLLGGVFGAARGALILTALTVLISHTPIKNSEFWEASKAVQTTQKYATSIKPYLPPSLGQFIP